MKTTELFSAQLDREAVGTRRALERVPGERWVPRVYSDELLVL